MIIHSTEQKRLWNWMQIGKGHAICESVAGSGKTYSIIHGLNLTNSPRTLYCVFGKKQQLEAAKKISNKRVTVSTYHSIGFQIILSHWKGVRANSFTEFGRCRHLEPSAPAQVHFQAARLVQFLKNTFCTIPSLTEIKETAAIRDIDTSKKDADAGWTLDKLAELALNSIKFSLQYPHDRQISFEDMVYQPIIQGWVKPTYSFLVSDEAQDASMPQLAMMRALCETTGRILLVGDSAQNIFGFRGTVNDAMNKFQIELNAEKFILPTCYRCPQSVIKLAQSIVPHIMPAPNAIEGEIVDCNMDTAMKSIRPNDVVLSRNNCALVKMALNLIKNKIPAYVLGRELAQMLIKTIEDLEPNDINDFYDKLEAWLTIRRSKTGFNASKSIELANDTAETIKAIAESCLSVEQIKTKINSLFFDADYVKHPAVICSTVHKFKGCQARNIYMIMETFSAGKRTLNQDEMIQERNILYVSYTRPEEKLVRIN